MPTVLLADDEPGVHVAFEDAMEAGVRVLHASDGREALAILEREEVDVLVTDLSMPHLDGLGLLRAAAERGIKVPALVLSGLGDVPSVVEAMRLGALDFLEKPGSTERLRFSVGQALRSARIEREAAELRARSSVDPGVFSRLVGQAPGMDELIRRIRLVAPRRTRVLITGENGSGKELVARAVHDASERASGPFVRVNCAALPEGVFESELFGHERGAFTGAVARRSGRFERAHGGTLFLDEIGDVPLSVQPKLLRALETGEVERVGGEQGLSVDARVVAATNRDLGAMVAEGTFREDLFHRLDVVRLEVPSLRSRRGDIPALARHFLAWAAGEDARAPPEIEGSALAVLVAHSWPGNVRELRNVMERLVIFCEGRRIGEADVREALRPARRDASGSGNLLDHPGPLREVVEELERRVIARRLEACGGVKARAAESLGLERSNLYKKMRALGMAAEEE